MKAYATRFTVWPLWPLRYSPVFEHFSELTTKPYSDPRRTTPIEVQAQRFNEASGGSRTHNRRFTKPELCQLSYTSADRMRGKSRSIAIGSRQARQIPESSQQRGKLSTSRSSDFSNLTRQAPHQTLMASASPTEQGLQFHPQIRSLFTFGSLSLTINSADRLSTLAHD